MDRKLQYICAYKNSNYKFNNFLIVPIKKENSAKAAQQADIKIIDSNLIEIKTITDAMLEKKAKDIVALDLRNVGSSISDHFIICNAESTTQVVAISDYIEDMMFENCNRKVIRAQGRENAFWIIMDYSNIVIHIFQTEYREFYRLEELWSDAIKTTFEEEE